MKNTICPNCTSQINNIFYSIKNVPVHSVMLLRAKSEALNFPTGDIELGLCETCGFIKNIQFNKNLHHYSKDYEETQGFSSTFNTFHKKLKTV